MRRLFLAAGMLCALAAAASADTLDPLHSVVCSGGGAGGGTGCVNTDSGSFAPLPAGQFANFGFEISPGPATADSVTLVILVPTNEITAATFNLPTLTDNNGAPLTETVFSRSTFFNASNGASLAGFLGLPNASSYSPTDNFSNASAGETATIDPGFSGSFLTFTVSLGTTGFDAQGSPTLLNDFSFGSNLPAGTVITALAHLDIDHTGAPCTNNCFVGTAASEDLVVTPLAVPGPIVGAGLPGLVAGCFALIALAKRRRNTFSPPAS